MPSIRMENHTGKESHKQCIFIVVLIFTELLQLFIFANVRNFLPL